MIDPRDVTLKAVTHLFRGAFELRRLGARFGRDPDARSAAPQPRYARARAGDAQRRSILFITSDQQRYDALGVNGGSVARTPALDALAAAGVNYQRAHVQSVVCMPSRSTMLTGQHPRTHGVLANGIPLPAAAPSVAELMRAAGYRTALIGKAHFDPHFDPTLSFFENRCAAERRDGPWHGFEHIELATHGPVGGHHYADWLWRNGREHIGGFGGVLTGAPGGDTGAPEVTLNPVPRDRYHTDWVAERARAWLDTLAPDEPFFLWVSFPDPHPPFDPPAVEGRPRVDWRDLPLPRGYPGTPRHAAELLAGRPQHWLDWLEGRFRNPEGGPISFAPARLTEDQVREVNAMIHVENELIDEACQSLVAHLGRRGVEQRTDIFYTSDHGELQGDLGLMFKGPYHVESLLHVPLIWRPAPCADVAPAVVPEPVGHVDLAPTFCRIAGLEVPSWIEGRALPVAAGESGREAVLTTFDSQFAAVGMHLQTVFVDGHIFTRYAPSTRDAGGRFPLYELVWLRGSRIPRYDGSEGELYDCREDPLQFHDRFRDAGKAAIKRRCIEALEALLPPLRDPPLPVAAPT
ncbi:MAG: sulfatase-like hydrolase/transferase [Myxococcales bacterium]|nr:sulfatase-like hydrolase/transferase [Myxococcales bacterium]